MCNSHASFLEATGKEVARNYLRVLFCLRKYWYCDTIPIKKAYK